MIMIMMGTTFQG